MNTEPCTPAYPTYGQATAAIDPYTPDKLPRMREVEIVEIDHGYIVSVGCQKFAIGTKSELIAKLTEYILEPKKTELNWFKGELF